MSSFKKGNLVVLALATFASTAVAQARPAQTRQPAARQAPAPDQGFWELGTDVGFAIGLADPKSLSIDIPTGLLRAGYYITPVITLEPALSFHSLAQESAEGQTFWMLQLGGLYHLSPDRRQDQFFVHPSIGLTGGSQGVSDFTFLNGTFGWKNPMLAGRLVMRLEGGISYRLKEGPIDSELSVIGLAGWSIYTK